MDGGGDDTAQLTTMAVDNGHPNVEPGREPPRVGSNAKDSLNFGWFSLPQGPDAQAQYQDAGPSDMCSQGMPGNISANQTGSRPPSQSGRDQTRPGSRGGWGVQGSRPPSQSGRIPQPEMTCGQEQHGGQEMFLPPPSTGGGPMRPPSGQQHYHQSQPPHYGNMENTQRMVVGGDPNVAGFEQQGQGHQWQQTSQGEHMNQGQCIPREIDAVDWPMSRTAQEMLMRAAHPPAEPGFSFDDKCGMGHRGHNPEVPPTPPTPMPPLSWGGYRGSARPTYASWRDQWHRSQGRSHSLQRRHGPPHDHDIFHCDYNNSNNEHDSHGDYNNSNSNYDSNNEQGSNSDYNKYNNNDCNKNSDYNNKYNDSDNTNNGNKTNNNNNDDCSNGDGSDDYLGSTTACKNNNFGYDDSVCSGKDVDHRCHSDLDTTLAPQKHGRHEDSFSCLSGEAGKTKPSKAAKIMARLQETTSCWLYKLRGRSSKFANYKKFNNEL